MILELNRNSMVLRDIDPNSQEFWKFRSRYSVWDTRPNGSKYIAWSPIIINDNCAYMPRTIGVEAVKKYFGDYIKITENYLNTAPVKEISYKMKNPPRNELQQQAIDFVCSMETDTGIRQRFLNLATGIGKTYITINSLSRLKKKAMIFVDTQSLADQWVNEFKIHSNIKSNEIMVLSGQDSIQEALKNPRLKIIIALHQTIQAYMKNGLDKLQGLFNKLKCSLLVFDEAHTQMFNTMSIVSTVNVWGILYLTATGGRTSKDENALWNILIGSIPTFNGLDKEKYHTVIISTFDSQPTEGMLDSVTIKLGISHTWFSSNHWAENICTPKCYEHFINHIYKLFDSFKFLERKLNVVLVFPTIEMIKKVKESLENKYGIECGLLIGEIKTEDRDKEIENHSIIFATQKLFGKGLTIKKLDILISCAPMSSELNVRQLIGRLRNIPGHKHIYIDITDRAYPQCMRQLRLRRKYYADVAKKIIDLKI